MRNNTNLGKKLFVLVILLVCGCSLYAQSSRVGNVKITLVNPPAHIYEGQRFIYFDYLIENGTEKEIFYNRLVADVVQFEEGIVFQPSITIIREDITYDGIIKATETNKMEYGHYRPYNMWGRSILNTTSFTKISGIAPNSLSGLRLPSYLKAGIYNIHLSTFVKTESVDSLGMDWKIKILPAIGQERVDMLAVMNAYLYAIEVGHRDSVQYWVSETQPTLLNFLIKNPKSQYAQESLSLLIQSNEIGDNEILFKDINAVFKIIDIMPDVNVPCSHIRSICIRFGVPFFKKFQKMGLISDLRIYTDNYLKRLEPYNPAISERLIKEVEERFYLRNFRNYAQERVEMQGREIIEK